jgi:alpha-glucosidase
VGAGEWWRDAVCYQIYPRSFADSNGDGVGDIPGITAHLDHLEWLGIECVWLSPTFPSPNFDWGYDVADYYGVHPELGTMADLDTLIAEAGRRGIRIVLDLVPTHTIIEHAWFVDSRTSRDARHREWYVWADPKPDGSLPNNWASFFMGNAWQLDERTGQYYLHLFLPQQPDLDWWNHEVRDEFDRILRFWFDRGIAGFRIDVAHGIIKDKELRDNPPATRDSSPLDQFRGQVPLYTSNRPEVHDVHKHWRTIADSYDPPRLLVGETFVGTVQQVMTFYGTGDELSLAFNIPFLSAPFDAATLAGLVNQTESLLPAGCCEVWTGSNHDVSRFPTRWAAGDPARARCAVLMLLGLRGSVFLYYGDELGMPDTDVPPDRMLDPVSIQYHPVLNRDAARTPMQWTGEAGAGFTPAGVEPWLPFGDLRACNVADQRTDPASTLHFTRDLIALRNELPDLRSGAYAELAAAGGLWAWRRGDQVVVALNFGDAEATLGGVTGTVRIATNRARDGETVDGSLTLGGSEGVVLALSSSK